MLKVGITGGIGVGKSLVCKIFATLGVPIYDADSRAKWLMKNDAMLVQAIKNRFGNEAYLVTNELNRAFLSKLILENSETAHLLEGLVHPAVGRDYENWLQVQKSTTPYVLKEAALLYEAGSYKELDKIIVVTADVPTRIARVLQRDGHRTEADIKAIIAKQLPDAEKIKKADFVIVNDGTQFLIKQVLAIHEVCLNYAATRIAT